MTIGSGPIGTGPIAAPLLGATSAGLVFDDVLVDALTVGAAIFPGRLVGMADAVRLEDIFAVVRGYLAVSTDSIAISPQLIAQVGMVLTERLRFAETLVGNFLTHDALVDAVRLVDALYSVRDVLIAEGVGVEAAELVQRAAGIAEVLHIAPAMLGAARYNLTITQLIRMADGLANFFGADMEDRLGLGEVLAARQLALGLVSDTVEMAPVIAPQLLVSAKAVDGVGLDDVDVLQMLFNPALYDGVEITAGYLAPDGSLTTWAMNARTGSVTEYRNYEFTSFAQLGNRYIATSPEGLYELLGDDDAGTGIVARIKSGYMQFGGTRLSRLSAAYIAATGEGQMVLKIITKEGAEYLYQTDTRDGRSTKVHMGKGQRSRYFAFELVTAGQDFDIDTLEFVPVVVQRRV